VNVNDVVVKMIMEWTMKMMIMKLVQLMYRVCSPQPLMAMVMAVTS
jgi:hypothetical protein